MFIVEESKIPKRKDIIDVPLDDAIKVYNTCLGLKTVCERENGIGISAVQCGIPWKLFLVKGDGTCPLIKKGEFGYFVNCEYEAITDKLDVSLEGCLSLRSSDGRLRSFQVERCYEIRLFGLQFILKDLLFEEIDVNISVRQQSVIFSHEADHSSGPEGLISVKGKEMFVW